MTDITFCFPPLPVTDNAAGHERLTGIEIEFAGPTELETGTVIAQRFGGTATDDGHHCVTVSGTRFGDIEVELDIGLRKRHDLPFLKEGLDAFRGLIPVEVVTPPLSRAQVEDFNTICADLRHIGHWGRAPGFFLASASISTPRWSRRMPRSRSTRSPRMPCLNRGCAAKSGSTPPAA